MTDTTLHRRHPRVRFDQMVRLRAADGAAWIESRAVDLCEGGLGVAVFEGWPVGCELRCELALGDESLEVGGVVAWTEAERERVATETQLRLGDDVPPARARRGMGIAFDAPEEASLSRLRAVIARGRPLTDEVALDFPGIEQPVLAQAQASECGLRLRAALPILREGTSVGVQYRRAELRTQAVVSRAEIDRDGTVPVLRIELEEGERGQAARASAAGVEAAVVEQEPTRARAWTVAFVTGLVGIVVGLLVGRALGDGPRAPEATGLAAAVPVSGETRSLATQAAEAPPAARASARPGVDATGGPGPQPGEAAAAALATGETTAVAPAVPYDPAKRDPGEVPRVELVDGVTRVRVPIEGHAGEMKIYELTSPGVAVRLPHARTPLLLDKYGVHQGLVRRVWLREEDDGALQVRVIFTRERVRHEVRVEGGHVVVDVRN